MLSPFMRTAAEGAATSVYVATDPALDGVTGGYFASSARAESKLNRPARDDELAATLWERSEQLTGCRSM
jgi:hypothetical protein